MNKEFKNNERVLTFRPVETINGDGMAKKVRVNISIEKPEKGWAK